jgi:uncharacterized protein YodC (DUF2158 family)
MDNKKFKTGDIVVLKSGGPAMTVRFYNMDDEVACQWFQDRKYYEQSFPEGSLEPEENEEPFEMDF